MRRKVSRWVPKRQRHNLIFNYDSSRKGGGVGDRPLYSTESCGPLWATERPLALDLVQDTVVRGETELFLMV